MRQPARLQVGDDLLDDGVGAVGGLGLDKVQLAVGERGVVAVDREQLTLTLGNAGRVEAADAADQQPAGDLLGCAAAGERRVADLGDLRVGDEGLFVVVPDRPRVADRESCLLPCLQPGGTAERTDR